MVDVMTYKCPKCGREIKSFYEAQLRQNIKAHEERHAKQEAEKKEEK